MQELTVKELKKTVKDKLKILEEKAKKQLMEKKREQEEKMLKFLEGLKKQTSIWECQRYIEKHDKFNNFSKYGEVKDFYLDHLIDNYSFSDMKVGSFSDIVGLSDSIFETSFHSISDRIFEKDEKRLNIACQRLLEKAVKHKAVDYIIPLKKHLNKDNTKEVRRKLDFMLGTSYDDREFVHNSVNTIYHYEQLLKWVSNNKQKQEISDRIVLISNYRIKHNYADLLKHEKTGRKIIRDRRETKKYTPQRIKDKEDEFNPKIEDLEKQMVKLDEKQAPFNEKENKNFLNLSDKGWHHISWEDRAKITKLIEGGHKDRNKNTKKFNDLVLEKIELEEKDKEYNERISKIKSTISEYKYEITSLQNEYETSLSNYDDEEKTIGKKIYWCASAILEAIKKLREYCGTIDVSDNKHPDLSEYYRFLQIVLDSAADKEKLDLCVTVIEILKKAKEIEIKIETGE